MNNGLIQTMNAEEVEERNLLEMLNEMSLTGINLGINLSTGIQPNLNFE